MLNSFRKVGVLIALAITIGMTWGYLGSAQEAAEPGSLVLSAQLAWHYSGEYASAAGLQLPDGQTQAGKVWGMGINANFPFLGVSLRYWLSNTVGLELNLAPIPATDYPDMPPPSSDHQQLPPQRKEPAGPNRLDLHLSGRMLLKISDNPRANFYLTGGPALTLQLSQSQGPQLTRPFVALLGEIEISDWPIERVMPVIDYGFALNLQNFYDFRWIAGGIGFHFYF